MSQSHDNSKSHSEHVEHVGSGSAAVEQTYEERVEVTEEDNRRILWKTDLNLLTVLAWVYWLQILDKTVLGYAATFGMIQDANLVGTQYSTIGSINAIAQLRLAALLKLCPCACSAPVPDACHRFLLGGLIMWNGSKYPELLATRFLLGLFEAACLPLFAILTSIWYRRAEQPIRVCTWYSTNGMGTIMASVFAYGFGHINNPALHTYQILFIFCGLLTVVTAPVIFWKIDNNVSEARFLSPEDRRKAVERLRSNNTGTTATNTFKWRQAVEALTEIKTWLFFSMTLLLNVGASVANVFGPLILNGIGFDKYRTSLLNMPFGAMQIIIIWATSYGAYTWKNKSAVIAALVIPVVVGLTLLFVRPNGGSQGLLLFAYYLLAFLFGANPLIISWMTANIAGSTKKSVCLSGFNAAVAVGNIIGPLLFVEKDKPEYKNGLKVTLAIFAALFAVVILQVINLTVLNKFKRRERIKNGKPADIRDLSMEKKFRNEAEPSPDKIEASTTGAHLGDNAFTDLTDSQNDEFVYVY
ncbi:hypothetical protein VNI00_000484 [Paramarasmius palmivorus]|uniref:Major facilitator superfamily transporter n=1 Tax=Paramarasmius palmivorus TaxID=297713 RepID=A0AAW0E915_9AGAR